MSEVPALYGQYDDEGNPLWMDGAVRRMFALRAENVRLREALERARPYVQATYENCETPITEARI